LDHNVGKDGVRLDPKNIEAMKDWNFPKTLKILHGFLGLMRYYRKCVHNYGNIATPLPTLLEKNAFNITLEDDQSFQALKYAMCTTLVLEIPNFTNMFVLECDVSGKGIGVVLV